jgi:hypothetical protein
VKHIIQHFIFAFFLLLGVASFCGCFAQSQNSTNVVQSETTKPSPTQSPLPTNTKPADDLPEMIKLQIKGVDIGTSYEEVFRRLGKPLSSRKRGTNPCGGTKLTLRYSGLTVNLDPDADEQNFIVVFVEVTSPEWEVSGIRIGASLEDVRAKFGKSSELRKESRLETIGYFAGDGYADFYFRKNKLVKVSWELNLC